MGEKLGMIGLGKMGLPLSRQMMKDGHAVCGYDIDPERMRMLKEEGGTPLASAKEVAQRSDITFSILLKADHIEENTLGPNGIAAAGKKGLIHVEMSTMHPAWQKELAGKLAARGIEMLDAPISGSHNRVDTRTISIMAGGKPEVFERVRPILDPLAVDVTNTGPSGSGATMKVVTNLFVNSCTALLAEMVVVGERAGLSHEVMMKCLSKGSVQGSMLAQTGPRLFNRDFAPRGAVEIFVKDMGLAIEIAREHGIELQIVPAARKMFERAEAAGWGKDDASRVIEVYEGKDRPR
ncbi:MAG: NAD(P)-dependent oxidoreductase [Betaproteobacteria bacterium]|nr:NAD(P)-dependent oxidoreductase [Betaproteobacteria bacterium]MDH3437854.1 NAD(P)-dependent oxidoreductase [Betaproteobacteria bacterium]